MLGRTAILNRARSRIPRLNLRVAPRLGVLDRHPQTYRSHVLHHPCANEHPYPSPWLDTMGGRVPSLRISPRVAILSRAARP